MTRRRRPPPPQGTVAAGWTTPRATLVGILSGLSALLLAAVITTERQLQVYAVLLAITILCGLSVLVITIRDINTRGRGGRMRPIRVFDVAIGLALLLPAAWALSLIWPALGL